MSKSNSNLNNTQSSGANPIKSGSQLSIKEQLVHTANRLVYSYSEQLESKFNNTDHQTSIDEEQMITHVKQFCKYYKFRQAILLGRFADPTVMNDVMNIILRDCEAEATSNVAS